MPFHNPVSLAEDIAIVDVISGGALSLVSEPVSNWRNSIAWVYRSRARGANQPISGNNSPQPFWRDRNLQEGVVRLQKHQSDAATHSKTASNYLAGRLYPPALRHAVRYGDGFTQPGASRDVYDAYVAELKKQNRPTDNIRFASGAWCLIVSTILKVPSPRPPTK